ncbi:MAG: YeeE/YedE thiosulfate transporter family protein [Amaricoccus sp.]
MLAALAAAPAFVLGYAAQRASICAVRATEQWVTCRRASRLRAFFGAAAWSGAILLPLAWLLPSRAMLAADAPVTLAAIAGGALFGLGAWLNGACALGTLGHLTRGRTDYLATLAGFVLGALAAIRLGVHPGPAMRSTLAMPGWRGAVAWVAFAAAVLPAAVAGLAQLRRRRLGLVTAFALVGVCGGLLNATAGPWPYTTLLANVAERIDIPGADAPPGIALLCLPAMLAGGATAAYRNGRFALAWPRAKPATAKLAGGALMGLAAMLIPGGNDALLLSGLPSLGRSAWAAYPAMIATVAVLLSLRGPGAGSRRRPARSQGSRADSAAR